MSEIPILPPVYHTHIISPTTPFPSTSLLAVAHTAVINEAYHNNHYSFFDVPRIRSSAEFVGEAPNIANELPSPDIQRWIFSVHLGEGSTSPETLVGTATLTGIPDRKYTYMLGLVAVGLAHQKRGLGKMLLDRAETLVAEMTPEGENGVVVVDALASSPVENHKIYLSRGYEAVDDHMVPAGKWGNYRGFQMIIAEKKIAGKKKTPMVSITELV
ncbi:hypothetical protein EDC01DRAFT_638759 [Geopyxis carbonaria]|nr:hypothetical protein EDC01DRAFT_638759 [Geopyxis carbonaria]